MRSCIAGEQGEARSTKPDVENGKDARLAQRRGPDEQGWVPAGRHCRTYLKDGRGRSDSNQNHSGCGHRDRRGGMHDDAERAVIRGALKGMDVGHLDHGQKSEEHQAHNGRNVQSLRLYAAITQVLWPESNQEDQPLASRIHTLDVREAREDARRSHFCRKEKPTERRANRLNFVL